MTYCINTCHIIRNTKSEVSYCFQVVLSTLCVKAL